MKPNTTLKALTISDLAVTIKEMKNANEGAFRDKVSSATYAESQRTLKEKDIHYPYSKNVIKLLKKELTTRLNEIQSSLLKTK